MATRIKSKTRDKKKKNSGGASPMRGGMSEVMKRAHRVQQRLTEIKESMKDDTWTAEAVGGKIKVTITGEKELSDIVIDKELVNPDDMETLQDAVVSAVNAAIHLADEKLNEATEEVTQGMRIPGLF